MEANPISYGFSCNGKQFACPATELDRSGRSDFQIPSLKVMELHLSSEDGGSMAACLVERSMLPGIREPQRMTKSNMSFLSRTIRPVRERLQSSKMMGCPALLHMREVTCFTNFKVAR